MVTVSITVATTVGKQTCAELVRPLHSGGLGSSPSSGLSFDLGESVLSPENQEGKGLATPCSKWQDKMPFRIMGTGPLGYTIKSRGCWQEAGAG